MSDLNFKTAMEALGLAENTGPAPYTGPSAASQVFAAFARQPAPVATIVHLPLAPHSSSPRQLEPTLPALQVPSPHSVPLPLSTPFSISMRIASLHFCMALKILLCRTETSVSSLAWHFATSARAAFGASIINAAATPTPQWKNLLRFFISEPLLLRVVWRWRSAMPRCCTLKKPPTRDCSFDIRVSRQLSTQFFRIAGDFARWDRETRCCRFIGSCP